MNLCQSLPGIQEVWFLYCSQLPTNVIYRAVAGIPVTIPVQPTTIALKSEAVCEVEESYDNNSQTEKAKLTFTTLDELPTRQHLAFIIRTADDDMFLIGAHERPFPCVKVSRSTGSPDGDAAVRKYEVSFTARKALAPCMA